MAKKKQKSAAQKAKASKKRANKKRTRKIQQSAADSRVRVKGYTVDSYTRKKPSK